MVKEEAKPSRSISRRRMRTQAEWKVEAHISSAPGPQQCGQTVLQFPGCLVGKGDSQDGPGDRRVQAAQPLLPFPVPCPVAA